MRDGNGECIGGVGLFHAAGRQQAPDHGCDLILASMAGTNDRLLYMIGCVLRELNAHLRASQKRNGARLPELKSSGWIAVNERLLNRNRVRSQALYGSGQFAV